VHRLDRHGIARPHRVIDLQRGQLVRLVRARCDLKRWFASQLPGEPVVLFTQTANARSMRLAAKLGFTEVERFEAYGAEQWFGMWSPVTPSD
jgi:hypothetical protein